jgi:hypothetical protein
MSLVTGRCIYSRIFVETLHYLGTHYKLRTATARARAHLSLSDRTCIQQQRRTEPPRQQQQQQQQQLQEIAK